jgi:hypothetical protein
MLLPLFVDFMRIFVLRVYVGAILAVLWIERPTVKARNMTKRYHFDNIARKSSLMLMLSI